MMLTLVKSFLILYMPIIYVLLTEMSVFYCRVTGGELFEDIVAREYYSEADAR